MIIIVGLGNPEKKYEATRHNVGFAVLDALAEKLGAQFRKDKKREAETAETTLTFPGQKKHARVLLAKPQTYMNNSGDAVTKLSKFYRIRNEDQLWIVHDDLDISLGTIRVRLDGGSAGQKGVQSIIDSIGTDKFVRFRFGIKPEQEVAVATETYVLSKFTPTEMPIVQEKIKELTDTLIECLDQGIEGTSF